MCACSCMSVSVRSSEALELDRCETSCGSSQCFEPTEASPKTPLCLILSKSVCTGSSVSVSVPTRAPSKKPRSLAPLSSLTPPLPPQPKASLYLSLLILQMVVIKISGKMSSFQKKKLANNISTHKPFPPE